MNASFSPALTGHQQRTSGLALNYRVSHRLTTYVPLRWGPGSARGTVLSRSVITSACALYFFRDSYPCPHCLPPGISMPVDPASHSFLNDLQNRDQYFQCERSHYRKLFNRRETIFFHDFPIRGLRRFRGVVLESELKGEILAIDIVDDDLMRPPV